MPFGRAMSEEKRKPWGPDVAATFFLLLLTALVYGKAVEGEFLSWDDPSWIVDNCTLRWLTPATAAGIFHPDAHLYYQPVAYLSWMADYALAGLNPSVFHVHNVILYALGTGLAFLFCRILADRRLGGDARFRWWFALATAVVFLLHPAHVESVVWATERKDMLALAFGLAFLAACHAALARKPASLWSSPLWWLSFFLLLLGVLSKGYVAILGILPPAALLLEKRSGSHPWRPRDLAAALPFLLLLLAASCFYANVNAALREIQTDFSQYSLAERIFLWGRYVGEYAIALVWPFDLPTMFVLADGHLRFGVVSALGFAAAGVALGALVRLVRKRRLFASSLLLLSLAYLLPGSGLLPINWSARYLLFPALLPAAGLSWLFVSAVWKRRAGDRRARHLLVAAAVLATVAAWTGETLSRIPVWLSDPSFYLDSMRQHPDADTVRLNAAVALRRSDPEAGWRALLPLLSKPYLDRSEAVQQTRIDYLALRRGKAATLPELEAAAERIPGSSRLAALAAEWAADLGFMDRAREWRRKSRLPDGAAAPGAECRFWSERTRQALARGDAEGCRKLLGELRSAGCESEARLFSLALDAATGNDPQGAANEIEKGDWGESDSLLRLEILRFALLRAGDARRADAVAGEWRSASERRAFLACWGRVLGANAAPE